MSNSIQDSHQYSERSIRRYERIFGADFLSTGGPDTTKAICKRLTITPDTRVLDVGSGIGGSAFYMVKHFSAQVLGVDVLAPLVNLANERAAARGVDGVKFVVGDILDYELPEASFDLIYSRDALLHIGDKERLFNRLFSLQAPEGELFISDYACGAGDLGDDFIAYTQDTGYHLRPVDVYGEEIAAAGYIDVSAEDRTGEFIDTLRIEIDKINSLPSDPEEGISPEDRDYLVSRWEKKIAWCEAGTMKWGHFHARKA